MRLPCAMALCLLMGLMQSPVFAADEAPTPPSGWMGADDFPKASALAKKNGQPLAIFFTYGSKDRYYGRGQAFGTYILSQPGLRSTVRVMVFAETMPDFLQTIRGKTGDTTGFMPQLYLLDPRGNIAGFAASGDRALVIKSIKVVNDLAAWMKRSDRLLDAADQSAVAGRYSAALRMLEPIEREDRKMTAAVAAVVPQQASSATTQSSSGTAELNPFARPGEVDDGVNPVDPQPQPKSQEELPPGTYYPDLIAARRAKYEALAADRVQTAQNAFDRKQLTEAKRLLSPMVQDHADFDAVQQAAELLKKVQAAEQAPN